MLEHEKRSLKKLRRKENKKLKLRALVQFTILNDQDRKKSCLNSASSEINELGCEKKLMIEEPNPKRMKRENLFPLNGEEQQNKNVCKVHKNRDALTDEQYAELKKLLKKREQMRRERPFLKLNEVGEAASITLSESKRIPLPFDDFQHFIITSTHAHMGTRGPSRWIHCKKHNKLERRIFLVIEGVGLKEFLENKKDLKTLSQFEQQLEVLSPLYYGGDLINEIALVPLTKTQKQKLYSDYGSLKEACNSGDFFRCLKTIFPIANTSEVSDIKEDKKMTMYFPTVEYKCSKLQLLLSSFDMCEENYPIPFNDALRERYSQFVYTRNGYSDVTENSPMWALDCEMCMTAYGNELTRICIVDEESNIVYETLVKPYNPIKNYLTQYSGITPAMMKNVKTRLEDVQADIRAICPPDLILVGHSLSNDLQALKMMHPFVIDTAVIFNLAGNRYRKSRLRVLVEEFLSLKIQTDDSLGHNPTEDAIAAMMLVQEKLKHSVTWGNAVIGGRRRREESVSARLLMESREAAGMACISTAGLKRIEWPQLKSNKRDGRPMHVTKKNFSDNNFMVSASVASSSLFTQLVHHDKNALLVAKKNDLDKWAPYCGNIWCNNFQMKDFETNRGIVKCVREETPLNGTGIAYISLNYEDPTHAMQKADKLVAKLMKETKGNTLYAILLAGSLQNPGSALLSLHLSRSCVPTVPYIF